MSEAIHVTIFGAGVAGLSVAHELVERGFEVTVVEKREDPFHPGECQVGGMARTQWARVPGYEFRTGFAKSRRVQARPPVALASAFKGRDDLFYQRRHNETDLDLLYEPLVHERPEIRFDENKSDLSDLRGEARLEAMAEYLKRYVEQNVLWADDGTRIVDPNGVVHPAAREHLYVEGYRDVGEPLDVSLQRAQAVARWLEDKFARERVEGVTYDKFIHVIPRDLGAALQDDWILERREKRVVRLRLREIVLPGEHGYRFFPAFYRHLFDIMKRIPILDERPMTLAEFSRSVASADYIRQHQESPARRHDVVGRYSADLARGMSRTKFVETGRTAYDNLISVLFHSIGQRERPELPAVLPRSQPTSLSEAIGAFRATQDELGFELLDMARYQLRILQYVTMCSARRRRLADCSWAEFIGIETYGEQFQAVMDVWPQALIGMRATKADAQTCGNISVQMLLDQVRAGFRDGTLNAPTSVAWLDPWRRYLRDQGVKFIRAELTEIGWEKDDGYPTFRVEPAAGTKAQQGYVVLALPVEQAQRLVAAFRERIEQDEVARRQFDGSDLDALRKFVDWTPEKSREMKPDGPLQHFTGIQYYLEQDHSLVRGHTYFANSPWGVTSISQGQFRAERPDWRQQYRGIISVDIGNCYEPGLDGKRPVWTRSPDAIAEDIWNQMNEAIGVPAEKLPDPLWFHIDDDFKFDPTNKQVSSNETPYLLSEPKDFARRPGRERDGGFAYDVTFREAKHFRGVILAGSYMKTFTRLATMESANESARHAVNAILRDCDARRSKGLFAGRTGQPCHTWNVEHDEFPDLAWLKGLDERLFARGLPHFIEILDLDSMLRSSTNLADPLQQVRKLSDVLADAKEFPWSLMKFGAPRDVLRALVSALTGSGDSGESSS